MMTNNNKNTSLHRYRTSDHSGAEERSKADRAATKAARPWTAGSMEEWERTRPAGWIRWVDVMPQVTPEHFARFCREKRFIALRKPDFSNSGCRASLCPAVRAKHKEIVEEAGRRRRAATDSRWEQDLQRLTPKQLRARQYYRDNRERILAQRRKGSNV
jgi:hypothetical protein